MLDKEIEKINEMSLEEQAKLRTKLDKDRLVLNEKLNNVQDALQLINKNINDNSCSNCLAGLEPLLVSSGEFCEDCANHRCIYCRGTDDCSGFESYDPKYKDKLIKVAEILKHNDDLEILRYLLNYNLLDEFIDIFKFIDIRLHVLGGNYNVEKK